MPHNALGSQSLEVRKVTRRYPCDAERQAHRLGFRILRPGDLPPTPADVLSLDIPNRLGLTLAPPPVLALPDRRVAPSGLANGGCGEQRLQDIARTTVPSEALGWMSIWRRSVSPSCWHAGQTTWSQWQPVASAVPTVDRRSSASQRPAPRSRP